LYVCLTCFIIYYSALFFIFILFYILKFLFASRCCAVYYILPEWRINFIIKIGFFNESNYLHFSNNFSTVEMAKRLHRKSCCKRDKVGKTKR